MSEQFPTVSKILPVGADMRTVGLESPMPPQVRTLDGGTWERPFAAETNYFVRQPRAGEIMREFQNSESVTWGASRVLQSIANDIDDSEPPTEDDRYLYFQRWHFPADFEAYGMWFPVYQANETAMGLADLKIRLALFETFPIDNTTQAWRMLPGAKFEFVGSFDVDLVRRLFIQPDPPNRGRIIIPSGWYYLLIYPDPPFSGLAYTRLVRDYDANDDLDIWASDRVTTIDAEGDWSSVDLATLSYLNDDSAPPKNTDPFNPSLYPRWAQVDFSFGGRFL